jgi:hypothetical protein
MSDGGKGSRQRQAEVPDEVVKSNWETIFGKKDRKQNETSQEDSDLLRGRDVSGSGSVEASS